MEFKIEKGRILMIPRTPQDEAYIEDTLGLKKAGDSIKLVRVAPMGLPSAIAYLEASPNPEPNP